MKPIEDNYLFTDPNEIEALSNALKNRVLSGKSSLVKDYEIALANFFGAKFAVCLSSGTAALHTALYLQGVGYGTEVLVPATAPIPSVLPILTLGATPVVVDTNADDFNFDLAHFESLISGKTRAVLAVPLWGYPLEYNGINTILIKHGVPLIEDAAQCHGAEVRGRKTGTFGKIGCFSTHDRKILSTGEGGFILTDDQATFEKAITFRQLGNLNGADYGVNFKLSALQCALGLHRLKFIDEQIAIRRKNLRYLIEGLSHPCKMSEMRVPDQSLVNGYSGIFVLSGDTRNPLAIRRLLHEIAEQDVIKYKMKLVFEHPVFMTHVKKSGSYLNATKLLERIVTFPVHPGVNQTDMESMVAAINRTLSS